jgi:hypothetical protein
MIRFLIAFTLVAPSPVSAASLESFYSRGSTFFDGAGQYRFGTNGTVFGDRTAPVRLYAEGVTELDTGRGKPAFLKFADLDGDGSYELVVSQFAGSGPFGSGRVDVYRMTRPGDPSSYERETVADGIRFPNHVEVDDLDGDGNADLLVPSGFLACMPTSCGGISWVRRGEGGWEHHRLRQGDGYFYHRVLRHDFDGDGSVDWLTVGEKKGMFDRGEAKVLLFKDGDTSRRPLIIGEGLGSLPIALDMDGDGDIDVASAEFFGARASFAWLENKGGDGWERHAIDRDSGGSIQLSAVENLFGDGRTILVGSNHTNQSDDASQPESGVFVFEPGADPRDPWRRRMISRGIRSRPSNGPAYQGAPGVFDWGDADGDGDLDIAVHGDGDANVYLLEQVAAGEFETRVIARDLGQGGVAMADIDGDGAAEIAIGSYERDLLYIVDYRAVRGYGHSREPADLEAGASETPDPRPEGGRL